jgi:predicted enzyme related to lactoylglutathione lyase
MSGASLVGKVFALADGREQAECLNAAGAMLRRACAGAGALGDEKFDVQCSCIVEALDTDGKRLVETLAAMVASDREVQ